MKFLVGFSLLMISVPTLASPTRSAVFNLLPGNGNYIEQLKAYFDQGEVPTTREIRGLWAGRCYRPPKPDVARAAVLIADFVVQKSDKNGPLFPKQNSTTFNVASFSREEDDYHSDYYDSPSSIVIDELLRTKKLRVFTEKYIAVTSSRSLEVDGYDPDFVTYHRKFQNYVISETLFKGTVSDLKAGTLLEICYYFKKIRY